MSKKVLTIAVIPIVLMLLAGGMLASGSLAVSAQSADCVALNRTFNGIPFGSFRDVSRRLDSGDTITVSIAIISGTGTHYLEIDGSLVDGPQPIDQPLTYSAPANDRYQIYHQTNGTGTGNVTWACDGAPDQPDPPDEPTDDPETVVEAVAGCDVLMTIPEGSVGGSFVTDAPVYWKPGERTNYAISAGSTARVIGVDASGEFYKIIWVCDYLWVPVSSMGPNFDGVWNGAPLPAGVVE